MMVAIPYVSLPSTTVDLPLIGTQTITVFGPLVALAIVVGYRRCMRYAAERGLDPANTDALAVRALLVGLVVSHWVSLVFYFPQRVLADPWVLLPLGGGLSSVGGFAGGALAFAWVMWRRRLEPRVYADVLMFGLLAGFTIGRLGCTLVHDHPGRVVDAGSLLAVGPWPDGTYRYDLGLIELTGLVLLCGFVYLRFDWRRASPGRLSALIAIAYGGARFWLDWLRAADERYLGLTPAQWACLAIIAVGLCLTRPRSWGSWGKEGPSKSASPNRSRA